MTRRLAAAGLALTLGAAALLAAWLPAGKPATQASAPARPEPASAASRPAAAASAAPARADGARRGAPVTLSADEASALAALRAGIAGDLLAAVDAGDAPLALAAEEALAARGAAAISTLAAILRPGSGACDEARARAAFVLGKIGGPEAARALAEALGPEPSALVRGQVVMGLGMTGDPAALGPLRDALSREGEDGEVRASAASALAHLSAEGTAAACASARAATDPRALALTLAALGSAADPAAARAALIECGPRADEAGRRAAANALARLGQDPAAAAVLGRIAREDPSALVRIEALLHLDGAAGGAAAEAARLDALREDAAGPVRSRAAEALGRSGSPAALEALAAALARDGDAAVRRYAIEGLSQSDGAGALAAVERAAAGDPDPSVRASAADARRRMRARRH